ncbi:MAG: hypothetical protein JWL95_1675 [Gemmatimonadetes bacterium]|jgi:hypothetical protein|nr:hypothetical protein [Gemmatimonadota bacterium]
MKFMGMVRSSEQAGPPPQALMTAMDAFIGEAMKAGVLADAGGLMPSAMGSKMRISKGKISVVDGPFTETKEVIGGYAVYDVPSKEVAMEWTRRFMELHLLHWPGWEGESELRPLFGP